MPGLGLRWDKPFNDRERRKYTEVEKQEFERVYADVIIVRYVRDWRSGAA